MLFPKFSIRVLLLLMVGIGMVCACLAAASRGSMIAFGLSVSIFATVIPFLVYAVVYWAGYGIASLGQGVSGPDVSAVPIAAIEDSTEGQP